MPFPPLPSPLAHALAARGYDEPTPVQAAVLAADAARDLLVSAQTGSGKTVAYGLAFAGALLDTGAALPRAAAPLALVVAPTRELAMQVQRELAWLHEHAVIVSCIGGTDGRAEARALAGGCHIVVGTPGRLCDHLARLRLDLSALRVVVLDEADEMLDLGFREELETLLAATPAERRTLLFSATIPREIAALARQYQRDALRIDMLVRNQAHADIEYRAVRAAYGETTGAVVNVLRFFEAPTALVFCATREGVRALHADLLARGFGAVALSGELTQNERTRALQALRDGQARVCVATDVAARGLDLPDLGLVIHADLPTNKETLLHRSGRTGRAGRKGICMLIVPSSRQRRAEQLLQAAGVTAAWGNPPGAAAIRALDGERLLADPIVTDAATPDDAALAAALLEGRSAIELATALIRLHRARLPAPAELAIRDAPAREVSRAATGATVWFSLNLGRQAKADPKWLVPLLCRAGGVTKRDIGAIRIFDVETRFEVAADRADGFRQPTAIPGAAELRIEPASPPGPQMAPRRTFRPAAGHKRAKAG